MVTNLSDIRERYGAGSKEYHDELLLMKKNNIDSNKDEMALDDLMVNDMDEDDAIVNDMEKVKSH